MEVLKLQLQEEVEDPFRAKLHTAEAEVSTVRVHSTIARQCYSTQWY